MVVSLRDLIVSFKNDWLDSEANLITADIKGTNLGWADLRGVSHINQSQVDSAVVTKNTDLPDGLEPKLAELEVYIPIQKESNPGSSKW